MIIFQRILKLIPLLQKKSFFLLGPRATGKSFLIRTELNHKAISLNLLRTELYLRLTTSPWELESIIDAELAKKPVEFIVIDEIQKIPMLLDEVHRLIEERKLCFLLTGSSARKLKKGHANLLAGRAWTANLYPLSIAEIPHFNLERYLRFGGLPTVYASKTPQEELNAYTQTYLYEEIQSEGLVRKLPQFSRFLVTAALANGQILNFANIANDTGVPAATVREYYSILEDTLLGFMLPPWTKSKKRKALSTAKFYLFDTGVCHTLAQTKTIDRNSDLYGRSFEHWVALELRAYLSYRRFDQSLCYWRTTHQQEIDFVIGDEIAIEVKTTKRMTPHDLKNIKLLQEEHIIKKFFLISQDPIESKQDNIHCMHWKTFMQQLWLDKII
ncbi:MAG: ATPase [Gammaproteobacteria bacterium RIFCSPHIGHO2_12_FULL_42_10]|nr:MAG: ATPase [Gammaproteobacteria bacterium RIFCSPHIGHO2_12_FULL_42_10]